MRRAPSRTVVLAVAAITALGLLLRLPSFRDSLFGDELSTYFIVNGHSLGRVVYLLQGHTVDLNPPLFFMLAWLVERLGDGASALRLVSLLSGTAAIPLTYLLGLWTVGRRAALVGAALIALSPFLIFFSSEARAYALLLFLVLASTLSLLRALDTRRVGWWGAYAVCSCAAIYTHYIAVFFLATEFLWAFWARPEVRRALVVANCAAALAYLPWLPTLLKDTRSPGNRVIGALEPFGPNLVRSYLARWSFGHPLISVASVPGWIAVGILFAGLAVGVLGLALKARSAKGIRALPRVSKRKLLVIVLAVAPPVAIALYSAVGNSVWESRNLIAGWPALALVVGWLLTSADGVLRVTAVGLVLVGFAIGAAKMLDPGYRRPDYNAAVRFIDRVGAPGDPVIDLPADTPGPLTELDAASALAGRSARNSHPVIRLYYPSLGALLRAPPYAPVPPTPSDVVARQAVQLARGRTLFVVSLRSEAIFAAAFLKSLPPSFRTAEMKTFPGLAPVSVFVVRDS